IMAAPRAIQPTWRSSFTVLQHIGIGWRRRDGSDSILSATFECLVRLDLSASVETNFVLFARLMPLRLQSSRVLHRAVMAARSRTIHRVRHQGGNVISPGSVPDSGRKAPVAHIRVEVSAPQSQGWRMRRNITRGTTAFTQD